MRHASIRFTRRDSTRAFTDPAEPDGHQRVARECTAGRRDARRFAEAETLYQNVIVAQVGVFGPQSPVVLNSKMNLATVLRAQGRTDESLQHYLEVIAVQRRVELGKTGELLGRFTAADVEFVDRCQIRRRQSLAVLARFDFN